MRVPKDGEISIEQLDHTEGEQDATDKMGKWNEAELDVFSEFSSHGVVYFRARLRRSCIIAARNGHRGVVCFSSSVFFWALSLEVTLLLETASPVGLLIEAYD